MRRKCHVEVFRGCRGLSAKAAPQAGNVMREIAKAEVVQDVVQLDGIVPCDGCGGREQGEYEQDCGNLARHRGEKLHLWPPFEWSCGASAFIVRGRSYHLACTLPCLGRFVSPPG